MNLSKSLLLFILIKFVIFCISLDNNENKFNRFIYHHNLIKDSHSYDVAFTTIPPRFYHIHHTILSWLHQIMKPNKIFIFIPLAYKRFRKVIKIKKKNHDNCMNNCSCYVKDNYNCNNNSCISYNNSCINKNNSFIDNKNDKILSMKQQLYQILLQNKNLTDYLLNHTINIIEVNRDYGPITKLIGILQLLHHKITNTSFLLSSSVSPFQYVPSSYWILCDDDVTYNKRLSVVYFNAFMKSNNITKSSSSSSSSLSSLNNHFIPYQFNGFTMFSKESRLQYTIDRNKAVVDDYYNKGVVDDYYIKVEVNDNHNEVKGDNNNKHDEYNISHDKVSNDDYNNYSNSNHHDDDHDDKNDDDYGDILIRYIQHIQGVDSYMIPMNALSYQYYYHGPLYISNTIKIINYLQDHLCYESFYQDDYVASFLFDISNINMVSLRDSSTSSSYTDDKNNNYDNNIHDNYIYIDDDEKDDNTKVMIQNIDGVSKFFYQMHMNEDVFIREYITQQCLMNNIEQLLKLITMNL